MNDYCWKLVEAELRQIVPNDVADAIVAMSKKRKPGKRAISPLRHYLNKPKTIWVQSIRFYGGENFGEPYYFLAEIKAITTRSAFSRFANRLPFTLRTASTY